MQFFLTKNDTLPVLTVELSDNYGLVDVTSGTPVFQWRLRTRASGVNSGTGFVVGNGVSGVIQYSWQTGDVAYPGVYMGIFQINFPNGQVETFPNDGQKIFFEISPGLL